MHATSESSALELAVGKHLTLSPQILSYKIATGLNSPLSHQRVGICLGRISLTSQGFIVSPTTIDEGYQGEIKIMDYVKRAFQ